MKPLTLNQVTIIGNVAAEPELIKDKDGTEITVFPLATERDRNGKQAVDYHRVECGYKLPSEFRKGVLVLVKGWLMNDFFEKTDGSRNCFTKIVCTSVCIITTSRRKERLLFKI
jgi:single-stranded DNA-binding protein